MELLSTVKDIAGPVVGRIWNSDENRNTLKRKLEELESIEVDINAQLAIQEASCRKKRKTQVANWLANVDRVRKEVESVEQAAEERRWHLLGDRVEKTTKEVEELIEKGGFQGELVLDVNETGDEALPAPELVGGAFQINKDKVLECLMKEEVFSIGIYGMGGVGKTTLVTHIYNDLKGGNTFHSVYWITVSQDFSISRLQSLIAKNIDLDLSNEDDVKKRAAKLMNALIRKEKCVIILDDLWDHFVPEEVGIPVSVNGCKLILTTRLWQVCCTMGCQEKIPVKPLSEKEAWKLFEERLGESLPLNVIEIAKSIAKECAGLPLGIVTMAGSMRGVDDVCEWRNAMRELQESKVTDDDMEDKVFKVLKFSYKRLSNLALQQCFLFCALYPEDNKIDREELIDNLIGVGIIEEMESRQAEYDKGHSMLNRLEKVCLLDGEYYRGVKMHDLIRDMAIQIMEVNGPRAMVQSGKQLREMPSSEKWTEDLVRCSLSHNIIEEIPSDYLPRCPNLSTLLLDKNYYLRSIPASFFEQMNGLKVLDLSKTRIEELPGSISHCVNLTVLLLCECLYIREIPSLAELRSLKKLDLMGCSNVEEAPQGMEMLSNLRYLDLHGTKIKKLPSGILPKLAHLQFLNLGWSLTVRGAEVASLRKLEYLGCRFNDIGEWNTYTTSKRASNLSQYDFVAGSHHSRHYCQLGTKTVWFKDCNIKKGEDAILLPEDVQILHFDNCNINCLEGSLACPSVLHNLQRIILSKMKELCFLLSGRREVGASFSYITITPQALTFSLLKYFEMSNCPSMKKLFPAGLLSNLHNLEYIWIADCENMEEVIAMEESNVSSQFTLPKLYNFFLKRLPELKSICSSGKLICNSLKVIEVRKCPKLKKMPFSLILLDDNGQPSHRLPSLLWIIVHPEDWWNDVELEHPNAKNLLEPVCRIL